MGILDFRISVSPIARLLRVLVHLVFGDGVPVGDVVLGVDALVFIEQVVAGLHLEFLGDFGVVARPLEEGVAGTVVVEFARVEGHEDGGALDHESVADLVVIEGEGSALSLLEILVIEDG